MHAVRRDIADIALANRVFAPHYAQAERAHIIAAFADLRAAPSADAPAVSQLLHGEAFAIIDNAAGWAWGYGIHDGYVGYVASAALGEAPAPSHVVSAREAIVFAQADIKSSVVETLPIGARFSVEAAGSFLRTARGFIHERHARPIGEADADPVAVAERLIGAPYRWGGRGAGGIDCSGLVQLALALAGIAAPRDSDMQADLGDAIADGALLQRGDLVFFPGHVGLMADSETIVHANAHWMAVTREPLADVVARIDAPDGTAVIARRRIAA